MSFRAAIVKSAVMEATVSMEAPALKRVVAVVVYSFQAFTVTAQRWQEPRLRLTQDH